MGTAVGMRGANGVVVVADRRVVDDGQIRSEGLEHLYTSETVAVATVGSAADVQATHRELDAALRQYRMEHDRAPDAAAASRIVSEITSDTGVAALVAAPDSDGTAQLTHVDPGGGTTEEPTAAIGDGAPTVLGLLETTDRDRRISTLADELKSLLETAGERETSIGDTFDSALVTDET